MDEMWITVENKRISGDFALGISKVKIKSSVFAFTFPQLTPQVFTAVFNPKFSLVRKVICNYNQVISLTHLLTAVITTNFKYKSISKKVPFLKFNLSSPSGVAI